MEDWEGEESSESFNIKLKVNFHKTLFGIAYL